jgi:sodium-coupled monocarboxylate transporter 8/12
LTKSAVSVNMADETVKLQLSAIDYAVFGGSLIVSLAIGLYYSLHRSKKSITNRSIVVSEDHKTSSVTDDYLLGSRQMSVLPVSFSLMASFLSAITLIGVPSEIYANSIQFVFINLSYIIATPIAAYVYLPVFYRLKVTSVYEVIGRSNFNLCSQQLIEL